MRETAIKDLADYREVMVSVGNNSTIRVRKQSYSVPSRLIGTKLLARIYTAAHQDLWKGDLSPDATAPYHAWLTQ
jgi:hypothetical protein